MDTPNIKFRLCAPLIYQKIENIDDFCINLTKNDDLIQCYNINPQQSGNIEPNREQFLDSLIFTGLRNEEKIDNKSMPNQSVVEEGKPAREAAGDDQINSQDTAGDRGKPAQEVTLPQGQYLLVQQRSAQPKSRSEWLEMAIEQQKDGLWERNKLGTLLYVRYLFEDEQFVTQVFRQVTADNI